MRLCLELLPVRAIAPTQIGPYPFTERCRGSRHNSVCLLAMDNRRPRSAANRPLTSSSVIVYSGDDLTGKAVVDA